MRKIQIPEYCEDCYFWKEDLDRCTLYWEEGKDFSAICKAKEVWIWEEGDKPEVTIEFMKEITSSMYDKFFDIISTHKGDYRQTVFQEEAMDYMKEVFGELGIRIK